MCLTNTSMSKIKYFNGQTFSLQSSCNGIRRPKCEFRGLTAAAKPVTYSWASHQTSLSLNCFIYQMGSVIVPTYLKGL